MWLYLKRKHLRFTAISPTIKKHHQPFSVRFERGEEWDARPFPLVQRGFGVAEMTRSTKFLETVWGDQTRPYHVIGVSGR